MIALLLIALVTLTAAAVALSLRNIIHSALLLIASWFGIAAFYLWAGAEFVAFAQVLVYVGAISMVVLFAVLLTRHSRADIEIAPDSQRRVLGAILAGGAVLGVLAGAILGSPLNSSAAQAPALTVKVIGEQLLARHAGSLLIIGVLLTVSLLGAIVIASHEPRGNKEDAR